MSMILLEDNVSIGGRRWSRTPMAGRDTSFEFNRNQYVFTVSRRD